LAKFIAFLLTLQSSKTFAIQITIDGQWDVWRLSDPNSVLQPSIHIGDTFASKIVFESSTIDSDPDPSRGYYEHSISSVEFCSGELCFSANDGSIVVIDHSQSGYFFAPRATTSDGVTIAGVAELWPSFNDKLTWMETKPFRIDASSLSIIGAGFGMTLLQNGHYQYSLETPLPPTFYLFGSGILGLAIRRYVL
jgi:hypothetical protein